MTEPAPDGPEPSTAAMMARRWPVGADIHVSVAMVKAAMMAPGMPPYITMGMFKRIYRLMESQRRDEVGKRVGGAR